MCRLTQQQAHRRCGNLAGLLASGPFPRTQTQHPWMLLGACQTGGLGEPLPSISSHPNLNCLHETGSIYKLTSQITCYRNGSAITSPPSSLLQDLSQNDALALKTPTIHSLSLPCRNKKSLRLSAGVQGGLYRWPDPQLHGF